MNWFNPTIRPTLVTLLLSLSFSSATASSFEHMGIRLGMTVEEVSQVAPEVQKEIRRSMGGVQYAADIQNPYELNRSFVFTSDKKLFSYEHEEWFESFDLKSKLNEFKTKYGEPTEIIEKEQRWKLQFTSDNDQVLTVQAAKESRQYVLLIRMFDNQLADANKDRLFQRSEETTKTDPSKPRDASGDQDVETVILPEVD